MKEFIIITGKIMENHHLKTWCPKIQKAIKDERNEKAWELYRSVFVKNYESYCNGKFTVNGLKIDCFAAVDEFIKQAKKEG